MFGRRAERARNDPPGPEAVDEPEEERTSNPPREAPVAALEPPVPAPHPAPLADDPGLILTPPDTGPSIPRRLLRAARRVLDRVTAVLAQRPVLLGGVSATVAAVASGWNIFGYPKLDDSEGATVFQATSFLNGTGVHTIASYGHVPGGPIFLAGWFRLLGLTGSGFGAFDGLTVIEKGRIFVVVLTAIETLVLFLAIRRLTGYDILATGGALLFALSPLQTWYGRALHPETFAAFWLVVALFLALPPARGRLWLVRALACGLAFGVAVTSMETLIVAVPGLALVVAGRPRRRLLSVAAAAVGAAVAPVALVVWLAVNNALAGGSGHASFIAGLAASAAQQRDAGFLNSSSNFWQVKDAWSTLQPFFIILAGLAAVWLTAFGRGAVRRGVGLTAIGLWALFASGLNIQDYFVVLALPVWVAASILALTDVAERQFIQSRLWGFGVFARVWGVAGVFGVLLLAPSIPADALAFNAQDATVQSDLTVWLRIHVPDGGAVVDNGSDSLDLTKSDLDGRNLPTVCTYFDYSCIHANGVTVAYVVDDSELHYLAGHNGYGDAALRKLALTGHLVWSAEGLTDGDYIHVFRVPVLTSPGPGASATG